MTIAPRDESVVVIDAVSIAVAVVVIVEIVVELSVLVRMTVAVFVAVVIFKKDEQSAEAPTSLCSAETTRFTAPPCCGLGLVPAIARTAAEACKMRNRVSSIASERLPEMRLEGIGGLITRKQSRIRLLRYSYTRRFLH